MIINFDKIEEQILPNFKGGDKEVALRIFDDPQNRIMRGRLARGASIGLHTHDTNCEIIFVTRGSGHVIDDGERLPLTAGDCHYCPQGHTHSLINDASDTLEFFAVVH